jgi:hypothetical protein
MSDPVRISVPPLGAQTALGADSAFSPALVAKMLCSVQADLQGVRAESAKAAGATGDLVARLDTVLTTLERIASGIEASAERMAQATETLNLRGWAIEHRLETMRPVVEAAKAAVEADTAARSSG